MDERDTILHGDALTMLATLPDASVHMCVTSPPYFGLRDYGTAKWNGGDSGCNHSQERKTSKSTLGMAKGKGSHDAAMRRESAVVIPFTDRCGKCGAVRIDQQIGLESSVEEYVARLVEVFAEVKRVLRTDGTLWLNLGDSYAADRAYQVRDNKHVNVGNHMSMRIPHGLKPKDLIGVPWRVAFALQAAGWWLRSDIIWAKPNPMPESVTDRPTRSHEYIFLLAKSERYYYDAAAIREPLAAKTYTTFGIEHRAQGNDALGKVKSDNWGRTVGERQPKVWKTPTGWDTSPGAHGTIHRTGRAAYRQRGHSRRHAGFNARWDAMPKVEQQALGANKRDVWTLGTHAFPGAHFATFPPKLIEPCILAGCPPGGVVLDPFFGSGTVGEVAIRHSRHYLGIELNAAYIKLAEERLGKGIQRVLWSAS